MPVWAAEVRNAKADRFWFECRANAPQTTKDAGWSLFQDWINQHEGKQIDFVCPTVGPKAE